MNQRSVVVVGGGAAGLMAAGRAAELGATVVVLERMRQTGRKLRITGKGRCNLTNTLPNTEFIEHFGKGGRFLHQCLARFSSTDLITFFNDIGLQTTQERGNRVFPTNNSAVTVAEKLRQWAEDQGVSIITGARVRGVDITDNKLTGLHYDLFDKHGKAGSGGSRGSEQLATDTIILATGGKSYPSTGSTGDGYDIAETIGHKIVPTRPSLVPLQAAGAPPEGTVGLTLRNTATELWIDGKLAARQTGELGFNETGLTGPIVLTLSRLAVGAVDDGKKVELTLDLKPGLDDKKLDARLIRDLDNRDHKTFGDLLIGLLPKDLFAAAIIACGVPADRPCHQVNGAERKVLRTWLKRMSFPITGYGAYKEAIVTAGGVKTKEVDPRSMESRLLPGLFIVGELLDVDGDTGGFNLQAAFSTGRVAGEAAAERTSNQEVN